MEVAVALAVFIEQLAAQKVNVNLLPTPPDSRLHRGNCRHSLTAVAKTSSTVLFPRPGNAKSRRVLASPKPATWRGPP